MSPLVRRVLGESADEDFAREIVLGHDQSLITLDDLWASLPPSPTGGGKLFSQTVRLNGYAATREARRADGTYVLSFAVGDAQLLRVICPGTQLVKVEPDDGMTGHLIRQRYELADRLQWFLPRKETVVEIPVDTFIKATNHE